MLNFRKTTSSALQVSSHRSDAGRSSSLALYNCSLLHLQEQFILKLKGRPDSIAVIATTKNITIFIKLNENINTSNASIVCLSLFRLIQNYRSGGILYEYDPSSKLTN